MDDDELIRRVATEVMGWIDSSEHYYKYENQYQGIRRVWETPHPDCKIIMLGGDFNPLTNLNHAFMVVEKMREEGWYYLSNNLRNGYYFEFTKDTSPLGNLHESKNSHYAIHKNLGHAISLAALKAVEGKDAQQ